MKKPQLGDKVKDSITGFTGVVVASTTWINGCTRLTVQPSGMTKEGKIFETETFDDTQLLVITPKKVKEGNHEKGGPRPNIKWID